MVSKLKLARIQKGMKQKVVARLVGVSPAYLCMIENKTEKPTQEIMLRLAKIYSVKPSELL